MNSPRGLRSRISRNLPLETVPPMLIRPALHRDHDAIWSILEPVIRADETYTLPCNMTEADALVYWIASNREAFITEADG
jgi:hypothetical protein